MRVSVSQTRDRCANALQRAGILDKKRAEISPQRREKGEKVTVRESDERGMSHVSRFSIRQPGFKFQSSEDEQFPPASFPMVFRFDVFGS